LRSYWPTARLSKPGRLSKRELDKRKGFTTFEGEIYRQVDGIIMDNWDLIQKHAGLPHVSKNSAGYALTQVKLKDGSFDLTPLFVGSQGTLGYYYRGNPKIGAVQPKYYTL